MTEDQRKAELKHLQECLRRKNRELDALHYVWCSGGCKGGTHRYTDQPVTAELVAEAIRNTDRLVQWYISNAGREYYGEGGFRKEKHTWRELKAAWNKARKQIRHKLL